MIEASITRKQSKPCTLKSAPTTALESEPILQAPTGWKIVVAMSHLFQQGGVRLVPVQEAILRAMVF